VIQNPQGEWHFKYTPNYKMPEPESLEGCVLLGAINDPAALRDIMQGIQIPILHESIHENCQAWVKHVVETAIVAGNLWVQPLKTVATIPARPIVESNSD